MEEFSGENSIVISVQKTASKISEIFASLVENRPTSVWSDSNNRNGNNKNGLSLTPIKAQPHSQDAFYNRVSTFRPGLWTVRGITPLECARWGWKLLEKDVLQCVTCHEVICAILPNIKDKVAYDKYFGLLKDRLEMNHKEACGWLYDPCPRKFVEPLHIETVEELRNLTNSAHTLAALNSALPYFNKNRITAILGADDEIIDGLFKNYVDTDVKTTAVLLVLSGWLKGQGAYLKCNVCRRQVGLWSFYSIADEMRKTETSNPSLDATSRKRKLSDRSTNDAEETGDENRRITRQSPKKLKPNPSGIDAENLVNSRRRTRSSGKEDIKTDGPSENITSDMDVEKDACLLITSPSSQVEKVEKQYFNPFEEHRHWCPWVTVIDDHPDGDEDLNKSAEDDLPKGFCMVTEQVREILQISKELTLGKKKKVENVEGLRAIRSLLDEVYCN